MPITKKTATPIRSRRAPQPKATAKAAPKPGAGTVGSMFDNSEQQEPKVSAVAKVVKPAVLPVIDQTSDAPASVQLGQAEGLLHRMETAKVQDLLIDWASGIATLRGSPVIFPLCERMRATEGRCAPLYFQRSEDGEQLFLLAGLDAFAAALDLGLSQVFVVIVDPEHVGAAHHHLATQAAAPPPTVEDDDLVMQVHRHYE